MARPTATLACGLIGVACGGGPITDSEGESGGETAADSGESAGESTGTSGMDTTSDDGSTATDTGPMPDMPNGSMVPELGCLIDPPPNARTPPPRPPYQGTCPTLVPGFNTITTSGVDRQFILVEPTTIDPTRPLPVLVMWHWLGGDAQDFVDTGFIQEAADLFHFIAIAPESKDDVLFKWPFTALAADARVDEEVRFFDDMVDCVSQQFTINESCIATGGVSAGALWTAVLASRRGATLSSIMSLSGGTRGSSLATEALRPWGSTPNRMPAFVLWGGPGDFCIAIDFDEASIALEDGLTTDGHFVMECIHNCTHAEPPFAPPPGTTQFYPMWKFVLDHPYWLENGDSPYLYTGVPDGMPEWCAVGAGNATIRDGMCGGSQCL